MENSKLRRYLIRTVKTSGYFLGKPLRCKPPVVPALLLFKCQRDIKIIIELKKTVLSEAYIGLNREINNKILFFITFFSNVYFTVFLNFFFILIVYP